MLEPILWVVTLTEAEHRILPIQANQAYLPVRAGLVIRKVNQLPSLLALHSACGAG